MSQYSKGAGKRITWSESEIDILKREWKNHSASEIQKTSLSQYSLSQIRYKAFSLGLKHETRLRTSVSWSEEEIKILQEKWENTEKKDLLSSLPRRTWKAISTKAEILGLVRDYRHLYLKITNEEIVEAWKRVNLGEPIYKICTDYNITDVHLFNLFVKKFGRKKVEEITKRIRHTANEKRKLKIEDIGEAVARVIFIKFINSNMDTLTFAKQNKKLLQQTFGRFGPLILRDIFNFYFPEEFALCTENKKASSYLRGRQFEYRVRNYFKGQGYLVWRSPQSKGPADLICIKKGEILLVQCKIGGKIPKNEKQELIKLAESIGANPILASRYGKKLELTDLRYNSGIASQSEKEQLKMAAERFGCLPVLASKNEEKKIKFEVL